MTHAGMKRLSVAFFVLVLATSGAVAWIDHRRASFDRKTARDASDKVKRVEITDTRKSRIALFHVCNRQNLIISEVHWQLSPDRLRPLLRITTTSAEAFKARLKAAELEQGRLERTLPVLNCAPNLTGGRSVALLPSMQRAFVKDYVNDKRDPITGEPR